MPGYNETEKIKILYEESLKDIRDVVSRIENAGSVIANATGALLRAETNAFTQSARTLNQSSLAIQQPVEQIAGAQEGLEKFIKGEMRSIYSAAKAAREQNLYLIEGAVVTAVSNGYTGLRSKGNKIFDEAACEFQKAINACVGKTSEALETLCRNVNVAADIVHAEQRQSRMIGMMVVAIATGVLVGVLTVLILK